MKRFVMIGLALLATSLVAVFTVAPPMVERSQNVTLQHAPYARSENASALHQSLFVADLHADSLLWRRDLAERSTRGHLDLPRLAAGNVALQVFSATTKSPSGLNYNRNDGGSSDDITKLAIVQRWPVATWSSLYARASYQLGRLIELSEREPDALMLIRSAAELERLVERRAQGEPVIGALYLIEGAHPLEGELGNLDRLFEQGLRIVGLVHFFDNDVAGSLHGLKRPGLSEFGRDVVRRADELGMIIDIAHASPRAVSDVLDITTRPVMLSHGGMRGHCKSARNLDDELMKRMASKGGLLGIGFWKAAVCDVSPDGIVAAIRYAIETLGVEHVALGSDFDGAVSVALDASELGVLTDRMLTAGFTEAEIRAVMGENVQRFLRENLPPR
ncbi:MAG: membrane dipeptidase [Pseudomonadota bacterium]